MAREYIAVFPMHLCDTEPETPHQCKLTHEIESILSGNGIEWSYIDQWASLAIIKIHDPDDRMLFRLHWGDKGVILTERTVG